MDIPTKRSNYYISDDGENFTLLETVPTPIHETESTTITHTFYNTTPFSARYIKVEAVSIGPIPDWHIAKGEKAWIFIDEIMIE